MTGEGSMALLVDRLCIHSKVVRAFIMVGLKAGVNDQQ